MRAKKRRLNANYRSKGPHYRAFAIDNGREIILGDFDAIKDAQAANRDFQATHPESKIYLEALT